MNSTFSLSRLVTAMMLTACLLACSTQRSNAQTISEGGSASLLTPVPPPNTTYPYTSPIQFSSTHAGSFARTDYSSNYLSATMYFINGWENDAVTTDTKSWSWYPYDTQTRYDPSQYGWITMYNSTTVGIGTWVAWAKTKVCWTDYNGVYYEDLIAFDPKYFKVQ